MLADFARGARTFNATQAAFCAALRAKQFYPALRPDRVSLPAPDFSLPVADDERSPSPEDPLFAADGKDAVVEAPVATARAISEEEAVEEALRRSLYDQ